MTGSIIRLCKAGVLDNPKAVNQKAPAAKVLASLLDKLPSAGAQGRRGHLALVRTMTEKAAPDDLQAAAPR